MGNKLIKVASLVGLGYLMGNMSIIPRRSPYRSYPVDRSYPSYKSFFHGVVIDKLNYIFYGSYYGEPKHEPCKIPYSYRDFSNFKCEEQAKELRYNYADARSRELPHWLVTFETRSDAEKMMNYLLQDIEIYGNASIDAYLNYYTAVVGQKIVSSYTNNKYGWDATSKFHIEELWGSDKCKKYILSLDTPKEI